MDQYLINGANDDYLVSGPCASPCTALSTKHTLTSVSAPYGWEWKHGLSIIAGAPATAAAPAIGADRFTYSTGPPPLWLRAYASKSALPRPTTCAS